MFASMKKVSSVSRAKELEGRQRCWSREIDETAQ
jgi:hypothetical protein